MPLLPDPQHEAFAQGMARGGSASGVCKEVYGCAVRTASRRGAELLGMAEVVARIEEIRSLANDVAREALRFEKREALQFLVEIIQTPAGEVDERSRLCQEYATTERKDGGTVRVKMPAKLDALKLMAQLCGWNAPEKQEVSLVGPRGVLAAILQRKQSTLPGTAAAEAGVEMATPKAGLHTAAADLSPPMMPTLKPAPAAASTSTLGVT